MEENNTSKIFFWKLMEKMGSQIINFVITIILARILGPSEYGIVALLSIFITFATVIVQDGFNVTLIRKKNIDNDEYKSSLYFSLFIALILYFILFAISPIVSDFYKINNLGLMLRVLSIVLFPAAVNSIQIAFFTKKFMFKQMFICNFIATIAAGIISVLSVIGGLGAWAIVLNQLLYQILLCTFLWFFCKWRPTGKFSYIKLKKLIGFGSKMLFTSLLINLFLNIRSLLIGKYYSSEDLGYFNRGKSFSSTMMEGINGSIQAVLLPTYANIQDNIFKLKSSVRNSINLSCYIIFPALIGLACIADPLIRVLLGNEWLPAVPFVQLFALAYMFQPTQIATMQALKAIEKGNVILFVEIIRKSFELTLLLLVLFKGPVYIALTGVIAGAVAILVTFIPNKKYLHYSFIEQFSDFLKPLFNSLIMGAVIIMLNKVLFVHSILKLLIDIFVGVLIYILISIVTKNESFNNLKKILLNFINRR